MLAAGYHRKPMAPTLEQCAMFWPSPHDYNEVIQSPAVCFSDSELRAGLPELTALGLPRVISGGFASVYRLHCPLRDVAVRCFLSRVPGIERRYRELSKFLQEADLPYIVNFEYVTQGIRVGVKSFPILKMDWVRGQTLTEYVESNLQQPDKLRELQRGFEKMILDLRAVGIAHGDLQHGNVIVVDGSLKLVDYDGMYVPSLSGMISNEIGHGNYQHPRRNEKYFGAEIDSFSAWVICLSLDALIVEPGLWKEYEGGDESLLFRQSDYRNPRESKIFNQLLRHRSTRLQDIGRFLSQLSSVSPGDVPLFDSGADLAQLNDTLSELVVPDSPPIVPLTASALHDGEVWSADNMAALEGASGQIVEDGMSAYQRGVFLQNAQRHDGAVAAFTRCKSRADEDELYLAAMESSVVSLFYLERYEEAAREYLASQHFRRVRARSCERSAATDAARQAYLVACGLSFLQDRYFNQAGERFIEALECHGPVSHLFLCCQLGIAYQMEGKFALARAQLELAASRIEDENDKGMAFRLGTLLLELDSRAFAMRCFARTLELSSFPHDPLYVESLIGCARIAVRNGNTIEALTRIRAARGLLDVSSRAARTSLLCRIGFLLTEINLVVDAAAHFQEALAIDGRCASGHLGVAQLKMREHDYQEAREHVHRALRYDPSLVDAHIAKAELLNHEGHATEAMVHYSEAVKLRPKSADAYLKAGNFCFKKNDLTTAIEIFSEAISRGVYSPTLFFRRGLAYARLQEHDQALRDFERCLEVDPKHFATHFNKGMLFRVMRRKTEALASLNQALALRPGYARILEQRAMVLKDLQRYDEAISDCDQILSEEPDHCGARALRGACHFGLADFCRAAEDLAVAMRARIDDLDGWAVFIASLGELGQNERVIQYATGCLSELLKGKYKSQHLLSNGRLAKLELLFERGKAFAREGRYAEALADFVAGDFFHDLRVIRERAVVHSKLGNLELAAEDFASIAMLIRPLDAHSAFQASVLYFQSRQNRKYLLDSRFQNLKFLELFEQAVKVSPELGLTKEAANCWFEKAEQLLPEWSNQSVLLDMYTRALTADPDHYSSLIARGRLLRCSDPQKSIADFERACTSYPDRVEAHIERGKCAFSLRKFQQSIDSFSLAIDIKPLPRGWYWRARSYVACGGLVAAHEDVRRLLLALDWQCVASKDPTIEEIAELSFEVCTAIGDAALQELVDDLDRCSPSSENVPLILERAMLKLRLSQSSDALKDFDYVTKMVEKRKAIYPTNGLDEVLGVALRGRGQAFLALRKLGKARKDFLQLATLESSCHGHLGLAMVCVEEFRFTEAVQHLDQCIAFEPDRPDLFEQKACILEKLGGREQAALARQLALQMRMKKEVSNLLNGNT